MSDYRDRLVDMVKATGEYITNNADKIVDTADMKLSFTISVSFDTESLPEIVVEQSHFMREVVEVLQR